MQQGTVPYDATTKVKRDKGDMSEVLRLYRYKGLLSSRRGISAGDIIATLEISRATFKRDLAACRTLRAGRVGAKRGWM
ncbi:MAG: hypothetical protein WCH44_12810, partial [Betaproteobacteria bacterium]